MPANSFGTAFILTTFGESHGEAIGGIIDGCPSNFKIDVEAIQADLNRRRPGQSAIATPRNELDEVRFLSGIFEGKTTGTPIGFLIENKNVKSQDYSEISKAYRPSHADFTYDQKYGIRDYRGGGRSSARETACRVVAGSLAKQFLATKGVNFSTYVSKVHHTQLTQEKWFDIKAIESNLVRCPEPATAAQMLESIEQARQEGDTLGGVITGLVDGVVAGLGEPVFDKLGARLAYAMMGINAVKGFEIGEGFNATNYKGSEHNDAFVAHENGKISTSSNRSGGIQGGISNGAPLLFRVAFKPVATVMQAQQTVNKLGEKITLPPKGRHDVCVVPRAVPIVEAMAALVLMDFYLLQQKNSWS